MSGVWKEMEAYYFHNCHLIAICLQATGNGSQYGKHYLILNRDTANRSACKQQLPKYLPHIKEQETFVFSHVFSLLWLQHTQEQLFRKWSGNPPGEQPGASNISAYEQLGRNGISTLDSAAGPPSGRRPASKAAVPGRPLPSSAHFSLRIPPHWQMPERWHKVETLAILGRKWKLKERKKGCFCLPLNFFLSSI